MKPGTVPVVTIESVPTTASVARTRRTVGVAAAGALGAWALAAAIDPAAGPVLCPFRRATGLDCPLCGATRAVHAFATGHPGRAFDHNLLIGIAVPIAVAVLVVAIALAVRARPIRRPAVPRNLWVGIGLLVGAFWILRNLPALAWLGSA